MVTHCWLKLETLMQVAINDADAAVLSALDTGPSLGAPASSIGIGKLPAAAAAHKRRSSEQVGSLTYLHLFVCPPLLITLFRSEIVKMLEPAAHGQ